MNTELAASSPPCFLPQFAAAFVESTPHWRPLGSIKKLVFLSDRHFHCHSAVCLQRTE
ncbi:hypothetical protein LZ31DRAFT_558123 [Colletotrichum somersetense]|nr:hypothetical protein LZ31DRAFT_558123 [Colletotrichum somersetense]